MFDKPCDTCQVLKEQLEFMRQQNKELTETLTNLLKPKLRIEPEEVTLQPVIRKAGTWNRRRSELEEQARRTAEISKRSPLIARVESIKGTTATVEEVEKELGIAGGEK